jgi:hypothetical protein
VPARCDARRTGRSGALGRCGWNTRGPGRRGTGRNTDRRAGSKCATLRSRPQRSSLERGSYPEVCRRHGQPALNPPLRARTAEGDMSCRNAALGCGDAARRIWRCPRRDNELIISGRPGGGRRYRLNWLAWTTRWMASTRAAAAAAPRDLHRAQRRPRRFRRLRRGDGHRPASGGPDHPRAGLPLVIAAVQPGPGTRPQPVAGLAG